MPLLIAALGTSDTGEPIPRITALDELVDSFADYRAIKPKTHFVTLGINLLKRIKVVDDQFIKRRQFRTRGR